VDREILNTADQLSKTASQAVAGSTEQANASVRAPGVLAPLGREVPLGGNGHKLHYLDETIASEPIFAVG